MTSDLGKVYTTGNSFRARAEARQREYRANILNTGVGTYGHFLDKAGTDSGKNFLLPGAFTAALDRQASGKGVAARTFENMVSSQAMCFNIFQPLGADPELAVRVLSRFFPSLATVTKIEIEHTPDKDIFGDQSGKGGVDCDVLIEGADPDGNRLVIVVETKFVETEFSICGFRKPGRAKEGKAVCPVDVPVSNDHHNCFYTSRKHYEYWSRTREHKTLNENSLQESGCPFGGPLWQLWVNHALAHEEAARRGATRAFFAVCASSANHKLLQHDVLEQFRDLLAAPESLVFMDLDALIEAIAANSSTTDKAKWAEGLQVRYGKI